MKHRFTVVQELDCPVAVSVAAYLDCEHYIFLHRSLTDDVKVIKVDGLKVTVRQAWKAFGLRLGHYKTNEYVPPGEFLIYDVKPAPFWFPSLHHVMEIKTRIRYDPIKERDSSLMTFETELDLPFWLWPLRGVLQRLVEKLHAQQVLEDMVMIKRREGLFGRGNMTAYLAEHHFCYHKDEFLKHFGRAAGR